MQEAEKFWKGEQLEVKEKKKPKKKINISGKKARDGLAQLILTVVELLRELMEKQAIRRIEAGTLIDEQVERLGNTFMALKIEIEKLKKYFELEDDDLDLDLGPLVVTENEHGKASVVEILDRLLAKGVVVKGDIVISVAEVDLIALNLGLLLASIDKAKELYDVSSTAKLKEEVKELRKENERLKNAKNKI